jgi:hypothetical protein
LEKPFVKLEVLDFDGCPSHEALMPRLRMLMAPVGVDAPVELRHVESVEAAEPERFLGSPTLRVDSEDVDPTAGERTDFGLKCRLYPSPDGLRGTVPDEFEVPPWPDPGCARCASQLTPTTSTRSLAPCRARFPHATTRRSRSRVSSARVGQLTAAALARAADRTEGEVAGRLSNWPNVERGRNGPRRRVLRPRAAPHGA